MATKKQKEPEAEAPEAEAPEAVEPEAPARRQARKKVSGFAARRNLK